MARVKLVQDRSDVLPKHHALFDELAALRGRISGPSAVVLHSPGLARPWNQIGEALHRQSILAPRASELAICATAREFDCAWIWASHYGGALRAGVSEATLQAVANHTSHEGIEAEDAAIVQFVQQITRQHRVDDALFAALLDAHDARWMIEFVNWIGRYAALSCFLNGFEVTPSDDAPALPKVATNARAFGARALQGASRIPLLTARDDVPAADHSLFDSIAEGRGSVRGPFALLIRSPELCQAILGLALYLREDNQVSETTRELTVIATARECDASYVWGAHAPAARRAGVTDAAIEAVRERAALDDLPEAERDIIELARQLLREHRIDQALFDRLLARHTLPGLVELVAVVGHYLSTSIMLNACEIGPAAGAEPLPLDR